LGHTIVTFDEAAFRLVPVYHKVWFLKGQKPNGVFFWSNKKLEIFGALIDGKKLYYEWHDSLNSFTYKTFLSGFITTLSKRKKYLFIFDNAPYHKSSSIMNYLKNLNQNIKIEFLPPYSPELNPTETCWKIIKNNITNSTYFPTIEDMQNKIDAFLQKHFFNLKVSHYLCP